MTLGCTWYRVGAKIYDPAWPGQARGRAATLGRGV